MVSNIRAIIPAAGIPKNRIALNSNLPDTMLVINGKPVIGHILEDLIGRGIKNATIILREQDKHTQRYVERSFFHKCSVTFLYNPAPERGLGYSVMLAVEKAQEESILVYLGDTIYKGPLTFTNDFLVVAPFIEEPEKWCFVEGQGEKLQFIDRPESPPPSKRILSGLYFFYSCAALKEAASILREKKLEMSDLLHAYQTKRKFISTSAERWYDCGNIENYYKAKIDLLKRRSFNTLRYDPLHGTLTKSSRGNTPKIRAEIQWYKKLPKPLHIFVPRVVTANISARVAQYSLEYYGYPTLADLVLFESIDTTVWKSLFGHIFLILKEFKKNGRSVTKKDCRDMYVTKTMERLSIMGQLPQWRALMSLPMIKINGQEMRNLPFFLETLEERASKLYKKKDASVLHGDLCFNNILFDPGSRIVKFIDPRGGFGKEKIMGDIKYDLAKLRHSTHGQYDFIVNDLFKVKPQAEGVFDLTVYTTPQYDEVSEEFDLQIARAGYSVSNIAFLEGLLFLTMLPLHSDSHERQLAFYLRGIQVLNESIL